jgi:predicted nuclease of predicted toxin-antitoxin system
VKLLFDQNLSPKLVNQLADLFPGSAHVQALGLQFADDNQIWEHCRLNGYAIVSKDEDYNNLSVVRGTPPKVIWLQLGNCTTAQALAALRARFAEIEDFQHDPSIGTFVLS